MRRVAIVGGGIAGLAAAYQLSRLAGEGVAVEAILFESSHRFGGIVDTVREGGFTVEAGPDGWVSAKPWASELARELGLAGELIPSNDATRKTWIYLDRRLVAMPDGLTMMVPSNLDALEDSPLFTASAIEAYRSEPARAEELRTTAPSHDESVADFTLRHFGPEVLERVAAPLLSGVFGGNVRTLSVRAVLPTFVQMERQHGSLISALKASENRSGSLEKPAIFTTLRSGLGTLIDRLVASIPQPWLRPNTTVVHIQPPATPNGSWTLTTSTGRSNPKHLHSESFDEVFLATDLDSTRRFLASFDPTSAQLLPADSSSAVLVAFCYPDATRVPVPPGFGFLVPPNITSQSPADRTATPEIPPSLLLACTFADQKFPHRVPPGGRLIRAFFGAAAADRLASCNNDEIAAITQLELARILNPASASQLPAPPPVLTVVRRLPNSLPQYSVGHLDRVAALRQRLATLPGLTLLGNSLNGVGIPDLIRDARAAATAATTRQSTVIPIDKAAGNADA